MFKVRSGEVVSYYFVTRLYIKNMYYGVLNCGVWIERYIEVRVIEIYNDVVNGLTTDCI